MSVIKKEVGGNTNELSRQLSRQLSESRQTEDRQIQTEDRQNRQDSSITILTQTERDIINILYRNDSGTPIQI